MTPYYSCPDGALYHGDVLEVLRQMPAESVQCCVTSPPYWGLRSYGVDGQYGLEATPEAYIARMVEVFAEVRRVLRPDSTCWINVGDSYNSSPSNQQNGAVDGPAKELAFRVQGRRKREVPGLKPKDLCMIPARLALALQTDGWWIRSEIVWHKPNPMPESVTDRPTKAHEMVYLLTKAERYFYDPEAVREKTGNEATWEQYTRIKERGTWASTPIDSGYGQQGKSEFPAVTHPAGRNLRSVWTIPTEAYPGSHFATFPTALVEPCVKAGTSEHGCCPECGAPWRRVAEDTTGYAAFKEAERQRKGRGMRSSELGTLGLTSGTGNKSVVAEKITIGWQASCSHDLASVPCTVLDPFGGSMTTAAVARSLGRRWISLDLNETYLKLGIRRIEAVTLPFESVP